MSQELVIDSAGGNAQYFRDLWNFRELFAILAWRDILVRYKQTAIGVAWAVIQPLLTMVIFTVVFGRIAGLPSSGIPYHVMVFAGLLPWQLFSQALTGASNSLVSQSNLISKVYFPRMIVPAAAVATSIVDFLIAGVLFALIMAWEGVTPGSAILALPLFVLMTVVASLGLGMWFSALTVKYRDFRFLVPFMIQIGLFLSPVGFSSRVVPEKWRLAYSLNPLVPIIDGFRWSVLPGMPQPDWTALAISAVTIVAVFVIGARYFLTAERVFADIV
jgi:lipopolysaccharide transport system permease protein